MIYRPPAHGLGQIEGAVLAFASEPIEPAANQQVQSCREVVALEECPSIDLAGCKILNLQPAQRGYRCSRWRWERKAI
jgi:hypothetical protein